MKLSVKPISSPGRTDKFPPPFMRFLRSNAGSKSRGRSKSSPMFVRKKNNTTIETQEPSSPKVTCMGQVRVRRSSSKQASAKRGRAAATDGAPTRCRCWWIRKNALFRHVKIQPNKTKNNNNNLCSCQLVWPKWEFFRVGSFRRKSTKLKEDSNKSESQFHRSNDESEAEHEEDEESEYGESVNPHNGFASSTTPPKNALLLTRCRSAPYRSSSLASRFWGSPLRSEEETGEEEQRNEVVSNREPGSAENEEPGSRRESVSEPKAKRVSESEPKLGFFKELEDSLRRDRIASTTKKSENLEELKRIEEGEGECEARPMVLTRCKSEPARTGHKLDPEVSNFLKKRRLGFADTTVHMISD